MLLGSRVSLAEQARVTVPCRNHWCSQKPWAVQRVRLDDLNEVLSSLKSYAGMRAHTQTRTPACPWLPARDAPDDKSVAGQERMPASPSRTNRKRSSPGEWGRLAALQRGRGPALGPCRGRRRERGDFRGEAAGGEACLSQAAKGAAVCCAALWSLHRSAAGWAARWARTAQVTHAGFALLQAGRASGESQVCSALAPSALPQPS